MKRRYDMKNVKRINKAIISMLMAVCCIVSAAVFAYASADGAAIIDSGTCGENLTWTLDENGKLTISGTGEMEDFGRSNYTPWYSYCSDITSVVIGDGVTSIGESAFDGCSSLTSINIPDGVTSIDESTFADCSSLTSINLPDGVTSIGDEAFYGCSSLTSIDIPDGVKSIGDSAFKYCSSLESIDIPDGVTSIGEDAFEDCSSLISIDIPDSVMSIGEDAFEDCSSLISIDIPDGVKSIGRYAFYNCSSLISIDIPDGVTSIGACAFSNCSSLTSIDIPDGVTSIGEYAFEDCSSLEGVIDIPDGVTSIGESAFEDCSGLEGVNIPYGVASIGRWAFGGCSGLKKIDIPESVTNIGDSAFDGCSRLKSINIPQSVESIGSCAFQNCSCLKKVTVLNKNCSIASNSLDYIFETSVFYGLENSTLQTLAERNGYEFKIYCTHKNTTEHKAKAETCTEIGNTAGTTCDDCGEWLTGERLFVPHTDKNTDHVCDTCLNAIGTVTSSGTCGENAMWTLYDNGLLMITGEGYLSYWGSFNSQSTVTEVVVDDGITGIHDWCFSSFSSLTKTYISDTVTDIGSSAFYSCSRLESVNIPDGVTSIGGSAFEDCSSLTSIDILDGVTSIGGSAFEGCSSLESIDIPDGVLSIGEHAFEDCSSLISIDIPDSVMSIGEDAFQDCSSLESIDLPEGLTNIGAHTFAGCLSLSSIDIPDGVTSIGEHAFGGCLNLKSIYIPDGVKTIYRETFGGCLNVRSIDIPDGVESIGDYAFRGCSSLVSVDIPDSVTSIGDKAFYGCLNLKSIYIPDGVKTIYAETFRDCLNVRSIDIPDSVEIIESRAFESCSNLESVNLPKSLKTIGNEAFFNCSRLKTITILNPSCTIYNSSSTIPETAVIKGYEGSTAQAYAEKYGRKFEAIPLVCPHANTTEYDAVAATCTEAGYTAGTYCEDCEIWIDGHIQDAATGHNYKSTLKKATTSKNGSITETCENCGDVRSKKTIYKAEAFSLSTDEYTYNGKTKSPRVSVADSKGNALVEGTDFSVDYTTDRKSVGEHKVTVTLKGNYSGKKTLTFVILPKATSRIDVESKTKTLYIDWAKVTGADGYRVYVHKGSKQVLAKNVTDCDCTVKDLKTGTKYEVKVKAYFKVDGEKVYAEKAASANTATKPSKGNIKSLAAGTKQVTVKWYERNCTSYQIRYSTDKNFGTYETVTVKGADSVSKTIKSLKSGKTYYFKIRAYKSVDGVKYYGSFSTVKSVKVK